MKYGAVFPQTEIGADPVAVRDYIQAAEDLGCDYLLAYDHVLGADPHRPNWRGPYTYETMFHEVFTLFAYAAAITQRIEFVTGILILPQRQTALVAKQTAEIDVLSGGRLRLGVAVGWNPVEYVALGEDFSKRGKRIEEQVGLLRQYWTQELVTFEGQFERVEAAGINPLPVQRPIPIWFGGGADVVLKRMARIGDGWLPNSMPLSDARAQVETLRRYLHAEGRDPATFGIDIRINHAQISQPADWDAFISNWTPLGATHVGYNTMRAGFTSPQQHIDALRTFMSHVRGHSA